MALKPYDIVLFTVLGTLLFIILTAFVIVLVYSYRKRYIIFQQSLALIREGYEKEILQSQLEIQNQTLRQVAEELHDNIGQVLSVASLHLSVLDEDLANSPQCWTLKKKMRMGIFSGLANCFISQSMKCSIVLT
ncbi:hypothetical protein GCM10023189_29940 [Nibrella saemangeumensis]|uniref:Signal transduction histidine kinase subgroup 3 dimerisation and phosphoacceptor domain-containing protein n=1 Tax=Nibrella saemangeumensis TaxID=1084526 RepID=A0ABP8N005_9BACT